MVFHFYDMQSVAAGKEFSRLETAGDLAPEIPSVENSHSASPPDSRSREPERVHFPPIPKKETARGFASPHEMGEVLSQAVSAQRMIAALAGGDGLSSNDPLVRIAKAVDVALETWTGEMANLRQGRLELAALTGMYNASHGNFMQGAVATAGNMGMTQVSWGADPEAEDRWRRYENEADMAMLRLMAAGGPVLASLAGFDPENGKGPKPLTAIQAVKRIATYALAYDLSREGSTSREVLAGLGQQLGLSVSIEEVQESFRGIVAAAEEQYGDSYESAVSSLKAEFSELGEGREEFLRAMAAINMLGAVADRYSLLVPPQAA